MTRTATVVAASQRRSRLALAWIAASMAAASAFPATPAAAPSVVFPAPGWGGTTEGAIDGPLAANVIARQLSIDGWATDPAGIRGVDIRIDGDLHAARYGVAPRDATRAVTAASTLFRFSHDFPVLPLERHEVSVVAVNARNQGTLLGRRSVVAPEAMSAWSRELDAAPALASHAFYFLMATSGLAKDGAKDVENQYVGLTSRTQRVGISVPILYMRATRGVANDWTFDPAFDTARRCKDRPVVDDNLEGVIAYAIAHQVPVNFILNGGIWADASCYSSTWDLTTHLEMTLANDQWDQFGKVMPGDYRKGLPGSTTSPELARSLTYHVYDRRVRDYKRRNLQSAARVVAAFASAHPDLVVGGSLDADTYMTPFVEGGRRYDYNPGMLRQFRAWLAGDGPYAGRGGAGVPDLSRYRRAHPLSLTDVNKLARRHWRRWSEVDPPRSFPGTGNTAVAPGEIPFWRDPWYLEWDAFRKHVVQLHYDELAQWVHETGIATERIFSAQAVTPHDASGRPVATYITSPPQYYDSAGVSIEGAKPAAGHIGVLLYGPAAENTITMEEGHSLYATLARFDEAWAAVEMNAADLRHPEMLPTYAQSYHAFRDLFNFGARQVSLMAWNGSSGLLAGRPGYVAYTSWRNTPAEQAMMDFLVSHADLPRGALMWTFGSLRHADSDGWTAVDGTVETARGALVARPRGDRLVLRSPPDQVIRPAAIGRLMLRLDPGADIGRLSLRARRDGDPGWTAVGEGRGATIAIDWPDAWRRESRVVEAIEVGMTLARPADVVRLTRVVLYPAPVAGVR